MVPIVPSTTKFFSTACTAETMRCATRISRSSSTRAAHGLASAWGGSSIVRAVGAIHSMQVGRLNLPAGISAGLQCTVSTSNFFPVDGSGRSAGVPHPPLRLIESAVSSPAATSGTQTEGNVYTLHIVGPSEFVNVVAEVLGDDVLVELVGRFHVEPYAFWRSGKYACPTVRISYNGLRSTDHSLRVLHAPDNTAARQRRLYRAIFMDKSL
ncbi:hypothetical protein JKF63_06468 [Porcisia hertigi]|uniref:Uncharacterized protein n=1 Tax=Porcisia hertigi TaxID=2761500 RepID=A0A836LJZ9_9TRYP|nr:hypothetical protein JKF63_06468 [Porcisia hertigi]